jgi:hypothetical protein
MRFLILQKYKKKEKREIILKRKKKLKDYYRSLEEDSINDYKPNQNSATKAKDRVFVELQLEQMIKLSRYYLYHLYRQYEQSVSYLKVSRANDTIPKYFEEIIELDDRD